MRRFENKTPTKSYRLKPDGELEECQVSRTAQETQRNIDTKQATVKSATMQKP